MIETSNGATFFIKTYGCQMNIHDSEKITNIMSSLGLSETDSYVGANIVLLNTCHIREKATEKLYSELGRIKREKIAMQQNGKEMVLIVAGCVAQAEAEEIFSRNNAVDIIVGPGAYADLPKLLNNFHESKTKQSSLDFKMDDKFDYLQEEKITSQSQLGKPSVFITVQEGCDKFCTFCVVPYTRGAEISKNVDYILDEVRKNANAGTKEIVLLGQNVNAFHGIDGVGRKWNLAQLISKIADIEAIERIRYTTSHPKDMSSDLIAMHGCEKKLMPLLNLPVQSGSDRILKLMNRNHDRSYYLNVMEKLRQVRPEIIFSSDFIVGFPGETDEDFEETIKLVKEIKFYSQCFSFKYSPRPGTPAETKNQISEEIKSARLQTLQDLLEQQRMSFNKDFLNKEIDILFDNKNLRSSNQIGGRTTFGQLAVVNTPSESVKERMFGQIFKAKVKAINANSFDCEIIS